MSGLNSLTPAELAHYDDTKQPYIYGVFAMILFLTNASVVFRYYSQWRTSHRFFADDWAVLVAIIISNLTAAFYLTITAQYGLGLHFYRVLAEKGPASVIDLFKYIWATAVILAPGLLAIKLALLFLYRRIFTLNKRWFRYAWWANLVYAVLWTIATTLYYIFQCFPPQYYWQRQWAKLHATPPYPVHGECASSTEILIAVPLIFSLASDIGILVLPLISLASLKMSSQKKFGLCVVFSFGVIACVCEILRIWSEATVDKMLTDPTYGSVLFIIITYCEGACAIIAACMPLMAGQLRLSRWKLSPGGSSRHLLRPDTWSWRSAPIPLLSRITRLSKRSDPDFTNKTSSPNYTNKTSNPDFTNNTVKTGFTNETSRSDFAGSEEHSSWDAHDSHSLSDAV